MCGITPAKNKHFLKKHSAGEGRLNTTAEKKWTNHVESQHDWPAIFYLHSPVEGIEWQLTWAICRRACLANRVSPDR